MALFWPLRDFKKYDVTPIDIHILVVADEVRSRGTRCSDVKLLLSSKYKKLFQIISIAVNVNRFWLKTILCSVEAQLYNPWTRF